MRWLTGEDPPAPVANAQVDLGPLGGYVTRAEYEALRAEFEGHQRDVSIFLEALSRSQR